MMAGLALLAAGCRRGAPPPDRSVAVPWATWPMPNARLPGLPHAHSYDLSTGGVVVDRVTGLMWQRRIPNQFATFAEAGRSCEALSLGGYHDWRLPSRIELVSLLDTTRTQPSIDVEAFPDTPIDWFWTASRAAGDPSSAWYVYFYFGYPKTDDVTSRFSVRCVRFTGPPAASRAGYQLRAHDVRDPATGLWWQRASSREAMTWAAADAYCRALSVEGRGGWRLPSLPELLTLIDETAQVAPAVDRVAFPDTAGEPYWSSSGFAGKSELAWYVRFDHGDGLYGRPVERFHVRCVL